MALIVRQSCSNNMFSHWVVPSNCSCCSFLGNMGGSTNPVAQLTMPSPTLQHASSSATFVRSFVKSSDKLLNYVMSDQTLSKVTMETLKTKKFQPW